MFTCDTALRNSKHERGNENTKVEESGRVRACAREREREGKRDGGGEREKERVRSETTEDSDYTATVSR